jgi:hypothetical protein
MQGGHVLIDCRAGDIHGTDTVMDTDTRMDTERLTTRMWIGGSNQRRGEDRAFTKDTCTDLAWT